MGKFVSVAVAILEEVARYWHICSSCFYQVSKSWPLVLFFYYLVLGKFLARPRVGGGNENKMMIISVWEKNKMNMIVKNFIFLPH